MPCIAWVLLIKSVSGKRIARVENINHFAIKFQFVGMIKARADENQSSALKNCVAVSKEKGFGNCFPKPNLVGVTGL